MDDLGLECSLAFRTAAATIRALGVGARPPLSLAPLLVLLAAWIVSIQERRSE